MRRVVLALVLTAVGLVALVTYKTPSDSPTGSVALTDEPGQTGEGAGGAGPQRQAVTGDGAGGNGGGNDGGSARRVTGPVAQTDYGPVQVRLDVSGTGKITKAIAIKYPNNGRSQQISMQALPQLDRAVVQSQGQNVDSVSGATFTSKGYKQSLQAALDRVGG